MRPPTDEEYEALPHVTFTSDMTWDPSILDAEVDLDDFLTAEREVYASQQVVAKQPDYQSLQPHFAWLPVDKVKATLAATTQWYKAEQRLPMRKHYKSRFPAANVDRLNEGLNEVVATDTFFSSTEAHDDGIMGHGGATMAQLYVGTTSHITAVFPMSSESQMSNTLLDFIRLHGAPNMLFSDNAKTQISNKVIDILRHYHIKQHRSEPYYQHQNLAERRIQDCKHLVN